MPQDTQVEPASHPGPWNGAKHALAAPSRPAVFIMVPPDQLKDAWALAEGKLGDMETWSGGRHSLATTKELCEMGEMQLWLAAVGRDIKGAALTRVVRYPTGKRGLSITLCGGDDFAEWAHMADHFRDVAKGMDCDLGVEAVTRPGIGKALKAMGWREHWRFYEIEAR